MDDPAGNRFAEDAARFARHLLSDPDIRAGLRALARIVLQAIPDEPAPTDDSPGEPPPPIADPPHEAPSRVPEPVPEPPARPPVAARPAEPLPPLTLGRSGPREPIVELPPGLRITPPARARDTTPPETIASRARLKAEALRLIRPGRPPGPERSMEIEALRDRALALPSCRLWMIEPGFAPRRADDLARERLAEAFDAAASAAEALAWIHDLAPGDDRIGPILELGAEIQSSLRGLVEAWMGGQDDDQFALYRLIVAECGQRDHYVRRYLRLQDPADPASLTDAHRRLALLHSGLDAGRIRSRDVRKLIKKLAYHAHRLRQGSGSEDDWRKVAESAAAAVRLKVPPSSPEIRDPILPIWDELPELDGLPREFDLVYREIDRYLANLPGPEPEDPASERIYSPDVHRVAARLGGSTVVFIGGEPRPHNREAIRAAFGLAELDWITTRDHQSIASFESHIARPEVSLVIVAIRWSNHSFEGAKDFCDLHGKPMLRLKAGYNANQLAAQILLQCSAQLGLDPASTPA